MEVTTAPKGMEVSMAIPDYEANMLKSFFAFYEREEYVDVTFVCKNNKKVLANKLVLSCLSPLLKLLFSQWEGDPQMVTLLVPEIDDSILKLMLDFLYEGTINLTNKELDAFKEVTKMLDITFPGISIDERFKAPPPAPPLLKLPTSNASSSRPSEPVNEGEDPLSTSRRTCDPDDDPLNVPDLYYAPPSSGLATSIDQNMNPGTSSLASGTDTLLSPTNDQNLSKSGKRSNTRQAIKAKKNLLDANLDKVEMLDTNRGREKGRKRAHPQVDTPPSSKKRALASSDDKPKGSQPAQKKSAKVRTQSFADVREDNPAFTGDDASGSHLQKSRKKKA